ncbi:hypothetical protein AN477_22655, partial [Alicyclobacillus ferrooxydans]
KSLIRAVIKKIEVEPNRKDIKKITFWFDYDDALLLSKTGGTVSQVNATLFAVDGSQKREGPMHEPKRHTQVLMNISGRFCEGFGQRRPRQAACRFSLSPW